MIFAAGLYEGIYGDSADSADSGDTFDSEAYLAFAEKYKWKNI